MSTQTETPKVSHYPTGDESQALALHVAEKIADELGMRIVMEEGARRVLLAETRPSGVTIWLSLHAATPNNTGDRLTISTHYTAEDRQKAGGEFGEQYSITVSASRSAKALAGDVARRLLPDAEAAAHRYAERIAGLGESDRNRDACVDLLVKATTDGHVSLDETRATSHHDGVQPGDGRKFYLRSQTSAYGDLTVSPTGGYVGIELRSLTPAQAEAVLKALGKVTY